MRPYVSIDIETTGTDLKRSHILEIGAVLDDGISPIEGLRTFSAIIHHDYFEYATLYAMRLNHGLIDKILKGEGLPAAQVFKQLIMFINECRTLASEWDVANKKKPSDRIQIAGKNAANFDIPILENQMRVLAPELLPEFQRSKQHRVIDVGSIYYSKFGYVPSLDEIKAASGVSATVSHRGLDDAYDVVKAIRAAK